MVVSGISQDNGWSSGACGHIQVLQVGESNRFISLIRSVCILVVSVTEAYTEGHSSIAVYMWLARQLSTTSHDATAV